MDRIAFIVPLLSVLLAVSVSVSQSGPPSTITTNDQYYAYARFSPSMIVIIVVLIAAVFFMGFFSIYVRHCSSHSYRGPVGTILRAFSRRASAAFCGLDPSVLETFPTLTYSEVREDNIGKGALECAVCLNEFKPDEALRWIPKCDHVFHPECIDAWLSSHVTCPVCRANLAPDPIADEHLPPPPPPAADERQENPSEFDQIAVHVDDDTPDRVGRRTSLSKAKVAFGFGWFRSHSTGHSVPMGVVRPGENLDRFTLRLPEPVRREVIDRARLSRTESCAVPGLPRGGSSRPNWAKSYRRIEREAVPDRWLFFSRGPSTKSPKATEAGESSRGGSRAPVKMPSFTCLEPKAADESSLFSPRRPTI